MFQTPLITSVLVWERILEIEEAKRKMNRFEDVFTKDSAAPKSGPGERKNIFAWLTRNNNKDQASYSCCAQEPCRETQSG